MKKTSKNKKLYIEIGVVVVIAAAAVVISAAYTGGISFEQTGGLWNSLQGSQENAPADCGVSSVEILSFIIEPESARLLIRNNGDSDNLKMTSAVLYDKRNNGFRTISELDQDFDKGKIQALSFHNTGVTCNTFSRVVVATNCPGVTAVFDGFPNGC